MREISTDGAQIEKVKSFILDMCPEEDRKQVDEEMEIAALH